MSYATNGVQKADVKCVAEMRKSMKKISVFLTERFETVEALAVIDLLRRAGLTVDMISITDNLEVVSAQNIVVKAEYIFNEYDFSNTDLLFLPGGPGTKNYEKNEKLLTVVKDFYNQDKPVAAICAAPSVFGHLGILEGKKATCFPGYEKDLYGAEVVNEKVVTDGNVTTGIGMGASFEMGLELIRILVDEDMKDKIAKSTQFII